MERPLVDDENEVEELDFDEGQYRELDFNRTNRNEGHIYESIAEELDLDEYIKQVEDSQDDIVNFDEE